MGWSRFRSFYRADLPHLRDRGGVYFITTQVRRPGIWFPRPEPPCLTEEANARIVRNQIHRWDGILYDLHAFVIMPDHVHLIIEPLIRDGDHVPLNLIMHTIKRISARKLNCRRKSRGCIWQSESFDRKLRAPENYWRAVEYIRDNPVRAGLVASPGDWPWTYVREISCQ